MLLFERAAVESLDASPAFTGGCPVPREKSSTVRLQQVQFRSFLSAATASFIDSDAQRPVARSPHGSGHVPDPRSAGGIGAAELLTTARRTGVQVFLDGPDFAGDPSDRDFTPPQG